MSEDRIKRGPGGKLITAGGKLRKCACCGVCECDATPPCLSYPEQAEYYHAWNHGLGGSGPVTVVFERMTTCCGVVALMGGEIHQRQRRYFPLPFGWCEETWDGVGTGDGTIDLDRKVYVDGVLVFEDVYPFVLDCCCTDLYFASTPGGTIPDCPISTFQDGIGFEFHTCHETHIVNVFDDPSTYQWLRFDAFVLKDPSDDCLHDCGACCLPGGSCIMTGAAGCTSLEGTYYPGLDCGDEEVVCDEQVGACCLPDCGGCVDESEADCESDGGLYVGDGSACDWSPCPPEGTGACCIDDECSDGFTFCSCAAAGGTFRGIGTDCSQGECDPDLGACCYPTGFCDLESAADCAMHSGTLLGANTLCGVECQKGACCHDDGTCDETGPAGCASGAGHFMGNGTTCAEVSCLGCCCVGGAGFQKTKVECDALGGVFHGPGSVCRIDPEDVMGASIDCSSGGGTSGPSFGLSDFVRTAEDFL